MNVNGRETHFTIKAIGITIAAMLLIPVIVLFGVSLNAGAEQSFPPDGLSLRWFSALLDRAAIWESMLFSVGLAAIVTVTSVFLGLLTALMLSRSLRQAEGIFGTFILSPLVVPEVVTGMSLLAVLTTAGVVDSTISLLILHLILTLPYATQVILGTLSGTTTRYEEASISLGAGPTYTFWHVIVPCARGGLVTAGVFTFVISFSNFTASQFLAWNRPTLPIVIYNYIQTENTPMAAALSSLIVLAVIVMMIFFNKRLASIFGEGR